MVVQRPGYLLVAPQIEVPPGRDLFTVGELTWRTFRDGRVRQLPSKVCLLNGAPNAAINSGIVDYTLV